MSQRWEILRQEEKNKLKRKNSIMQKMEGILSETLEKRRGTSDHKESPGMNKHTSSQKQAGRQGTWAGPL